MWFKEGEKCEQMAKKIAEEHIRKANPSMWGGEGEEPDDFDSRIATYQIDADTELDISFEPDEEEEGWTHCCELRDTKTGELLEIMHGYGVDSVLNLTDTIADICGYMFR